MLLHLHGLIDDVNDLDVAVPVGSRDAVRTASQAWWLGEVPAGGSVFASEWRVKLDVDGVRAHVFGGFALNIDGSRVELPARSDHTIEVEGTPIALAPLVDWWLVYRETNPERAALLEPVVAPGARAQLLAELGIA